MQTAISSNIKFNSKCYLSWIFDKCIIEGENSPDLEPEHPIEHNYLDLQLEHSLEHGMNIENSTSAHLDCDESHRYFLALERVIHEEEQDKGEGGMIIENSSMAHLDCTDKSYHHNSAIVICGEEGQCNSLAASNSTLESHNYVFTAK